MNKVYLPESHKAKQKQPSTGLDRRWGFPEKFRPPDFWIIIT
jgi:hypothetical protein